MSVTAWFLVSSSGTRHRLPREMIFVGREDCELMLQSRSVDKQHAVINYDPATDEHLVKDLGSLNGTFVNDLRIPDQTYITLKLSDVVRFGYDSHVYIMERSQHKVPEEALKHEKYTSQLQMGLKALDAKKREQVEEKSCKSTESPRSKLDKSERKSATATETPLSKPTPLYGQPSWWGDADEEKKGQSREISAENQKEDSRHEINGSTSEHQDGPDKPVYSYQKDDSYFEIPTKELNSLQKTAEPEVQVIPTKDTDSRAPPTPPVVQSHASFTIEFDDCTPGKMKIKDHVTKFSFRQRKTPSKESVCTPTEVISAESKVADWLVQSDASMARRKSRSEDLYSNKSDLSINKTLKDGHHHEDGTQSDSEDPALNTQEVLPADADVTTPPRLYTPPEREDPPASSTPRSQNHGKQEAQQAFVIEFFGDNARKKRSQSFTNNTSPPESSGSLKNKTERTKGPPRTGDQLSLSTARNAPTQQFTVPLKDSSGFQRAGSLRKEKTDVRMSSSNFSSRSASSRAFNSVGRRSKLAQDFAAEFLKVSKTSSSASWEKSQSSTPSPASESASIPTINPSTQPLPPVSTVKQPQVSPSAASIETPLPASKPTNSTEVKNTKGQRLEEDDSLSDAGTYTIETEGPDKEVEEARSRIDQVFGVGEGPEHSSQPSAGVRTVVGDREGQDSLPLSEECPGPVLTKYPDFSDLSMCPAQLESMVLTPGNTRWVSRWASLADNYSDSGSASGLFDLPVQMDLSADGRIIHQAMLNRTIDGTETETGQSSRARRILPQVPSMEKTETPPPSIHVHSDSYLPNYENVEKSVRGSRQKEDLQKLFVQDDLEPDSLSDASKSDDGSIVEQCRKTTSSAVKSPTSSKHLKEASSSSSSSSASGGSKMVKDQDGSPKFSTATITRQHGGHGASNDKSNHSPPSRDTSQSVESSLSLLRQESFTKDRPSDDVHFTRLPHISTFDSSSSVDKNAFKAACSQDTQSYLKETENVLASLEAKLQGQSYDSNVQPCPLEDSLSGDSDVDTSSTVSQRSGKNVVSSAPKKPVMLSGLLKEKRTVSQQVQEQNSRFQSPVEAQSQVFRSLPVESDYKVESDKRMQLRHSSGKHGSLDFGNEPQTSTLRQWPETVSDQEMSSRPTHRKYTAPLQKDNSNKSTKNAVANALSRSNSLSAPRATRTSMLRRARLGDASDNDGTETDRTSQNSDANPPNARSHDSKKLSRLDILALPRKRTGSFTTPSDTESSAGKTGFSNRSSESGFSVRKASVPDNKSTTQKSSGAITRQPIIRGRSSSAKYASSTASSRRRQKGSDYTSTSEDEYESNQSTPKHKRSHHSGALNSSRTQNLGPVRPAPRSRDSEGEGHESDAFQNWTTHSAEIARLSQDLAKDLAILAREIHDVAGDTEPQNQATGEAVEPVSAISICEELRHQIPETSLNYPKVPPVSGVIRSSDKTVNDQSLKQQRRNQEQLPLDNGLLNPVSQLSVAIRENTEQLTEKIKILFHSKSEVWEEIEAKVSAAAAADNDPPSENQNKEITAILRDLRGIQKRLEVINRIIEPSGSPAVVKSLVTGSSSTAGMRTFRVSPRDSRTPSSQRGGGPSAGSRRFGRGPEGEGFVV
ncbi:centrosomal protein of 170 kDa protein B isoform X1 [Astyanax mexicanus]|uniref:centrosomal protein of 170 kDa protein B isoform X1 n=1 Tax=Astyanax mexicanus TaxID=7994 RepID=UPI0020CABFD1|nr:centrosomal protein of 170 kDa protein B isoform X1 [Astyanax mexicanus]